MKKTILHASLFIGSMTCALSTQAQTTFSYTGGVQTYTVGAGVDNVCIDARGASGGNSVSSVTNSGGKGARVECNLAVTPGQVLYIYVGGVGGNGSFSTPAGGGYNGGGPAGYYIGSGGGGGTDIRTGGTALSNRVVVAGGGGGAGEGTPPTAGYTRGGAGGYTGANGYHNNVNTGLQGGQGGSAAAGGAGGGTTSAGTAGSLGQGGTGSTMSYGGGGGGGYYGGGGGGFTGGGGGSSYVDLSLASYDDYTDDYNTGNGSLTITTGCLSSIAGPSAFCISGSSTVTNDHTGGVWSTTSSTVTIGSLSGVVTGVSAGTAVISYTDGTHTVTKTFPVNSCPLQTGIAAKEAIRIYPNPASQVLNIIADATGYSTIIITDNIGRQVLHQAITASQTNVHLASLPAGMYHIQLRGEGGSVVRQFIKE